MEKKFLIILFLILFLLCCDLYAAQICIDTSAVEYSAETIRIPVYFEHVTSEDVTAFNTTIEFDEECMTFSHIEAADALIAGEKEVYAHEKKSGELNLIAFGLNTRQISNGILMYLSFLVNEAVATQEISVSMHHVHASTSTTRAVEIALPYVSQSIMIDEPRLTYEDAARTNIPERAPVSVYAITVQSGKGGMILPSGQIRISEGEDQWFTVHALRGYRIGAVFIDGVSVGVKTQIPLYSVSKNHLIEALFFPLYRISSVKNNIFHPEIQDDDSI